MRFSKVLLVMLILAIALLGVVTFTPRHTAYACLPCNCHVENPPANCYGPYSLFLHKYGDGTYDMEFLTLDGQQIFYLKAADLAKLPANPEQHTLIARSRSFPIEVYKLTSGDYQVQAGPVGEKKVFVVILDHTNGARIFEQDYVVP